MDVAGQPLPFRAGRLHRHGPGQVLPGLPGQLDRVADDQAGQQQQDDVVQGGLGRGPDLDQIGDRERHGSSQAAAATAPDRPGQYRRGRPDHRQGLCTGFDPGRVVQRAGGQHGRHRQAQINHQHRHGQGAAAGQGRGPGEGPQRGPAGHRGQHQPAGRRVPVVAEHPGVEQHGVAERDPAEDADRPPQGQVTGDVPARCPDRRTRFRPGHHRGGLSRCRPEGRPGGRPRCGPGRPSGRHRSRSPPRSRPVSAASPPRSALSW